MSSHVIVVNSNPLTDKFSVCIQSDSCEYDPLRSSNMLLQILINNYK